MAGMEDRQDVGTAWATQIDGFEAGNPLVSGGVAGLVLGLVLGFTYWTHHMSTTHMLIALGVVAFCLVVGAFIGFAVSKINPKHSTHS